MSIFAIIPVKELSEAKSRLSPFLLEEERRLFCLKMLEDVVKAVKSAKCIPKTVVVSGDNEVLRFSETLQTHPLKETQSGLNRALSEAIKHCILQGATSVLILPADIPLVTPEDIVKIFSFKEKTSVAISPSRNENGTNALLLTPPNILPLFYGRNSFQHFLKESQKRGLRLQVWKSPRLALDIDTVEDLAEFVALNNKDSQAYMFLREINATERLDCRK